MNKKTKTKILTLSAVSALSLAAIWVLASNPNDLLFKWAVKQDAHLELSGVTLIAPTQSSNFDVSFKMSWDQLITLTGTNTAGNSVQGNGTLSFWGSNNKTSDPESLILGGSSNEIANTAKENIIGASQWVKTAGESTTNHGKGNVILASSGVNLTGIGNILRAGNSTKIHGNDNLTFATDKVNISANNSMAIGIWIQIDHDGSFVFNGTSKWETTRKANTAIIKASNGMIINANTKTADNTDLTINGSLQVGNSQIDTAGAIIYNDNCLQLKNTKLGRIGLNCPNATNTDGPFLSFGEVACGRNAGDYGYNEIQWHSGKKDSDFCSKGRLDGEAPKFFDSEDRAAAYKTRGGSYASEWFGYTFHICFNDQDPTCALPKLKKSWTCSDSNGNRLHCQATQDSGKKGQKQTPVSCPSGQHLTNGSCVANTKTVNCDKTWINTANGSVNTSQVAITRSEATKSWSKPAKCDFTCNNGYKKSNNQCVKDTPKEIETPPTPQRCPKPVISNVDVSKDKIYFSAPNAYALTVNRSSDKIHWSNDTAWATSPRDYRYWKYIKITSHCNGWNIESDIFEVKNPKSDPYYQGKIDRNGNPFEWENNTIYDENRQKIWIISKIIDCSPDTRNFGWSPISNRLQCYSYNINDGTNWLSTPYGGNTRLLQFLVGRGTYYVPWIDNQRDKFNVEVINYVTHDWNYSSPSSRQGSKITNIERRIWPSRK